MIELHVARIEHVATALAGWIKAGFPVVSESEFQARQAACAACPKLRASPIGPICGICGCSTRLKPWLATERCKLKRWPPHTHRTTDAKLLHLAAKGS